MQFIRLIAPITLLLALSACHTVDLDSTGEMQAVYQFGNFKMLVNANASATAKATAAAFKQLDLYLTGQTLNTYDAKLDARARDDKLVVVRIEEVNSRQSMVHIRIGDNGNLDRSRELYDAIEAKLR
ncbi:MAG TPA: DUF3568 family protein [Opitutaceae bacterium]|nr:DUF3568 family protein [Opitutaceae bacterium]